MRMLRRSVATSLFSVAVLAMTIASFVATDANACGRRGGCGGYYGGYSHGSYGGCYSGYSYQPVYYGGGGCYSGHTHCAPVYQPVYQPVYFGGYGGGWGGCGPGGCGY